ncbi:MAG: carbohydrate porin [Candidatus Omnitrophota bacterium]
MKKTALVLFCLFFASIPAFGAYGGQVSGKNFSDPPDTAVKPWILYNPGEGITVKGIDARIQPSTTLFLQGTPNTNTGDGHGRFGGSWVGYLHITKGLGEWAFTSALFEFGLGDTIQKRLSLLNDVNYNAYDVGGNIRLRTYYYEQYLLDKQITLFCGKSNPRNMVDQVKYASDDDTQFIAYIFNRSPVLEWPSYTFTMHANVSPKVIDFLECEFNYFEGDANWQKIFTHGVYTAQINFKSAELLDLDPANWEGNYRFYGWLNNRKHAKLVEEGEASSAKANESNYGFGLGFDQMLGDVFGVFGRFGWQRPDLIPADGGATIDLSWSSGAQMTGRYWDRENDILAIAVGQLFPSKRYKEAGYNAAPEGHIETYYSFQLNKCLRISPDFQLIWNPDGVSKKSAGDSDPIFTYGVRMHMVF